MSTGATEYRIQVEPAGVRTRAYIAGTCVADSTASLVMHETRLPSRVYFPKSDLAPDLLEQSSFRTFCPFKGTGNHWHVKVGDRRFENSAWSYENPIVDARPVDGYVSFYPNVAEIVVDEGALPATPEIGYTSGPLVEWLLREAWQCETAGELTRQFAERLVFDGVPLSRLSVSVWTLHAEVFGKRYLWSPGMETVAETDLPHAVLRQPTYLNSPFRYVRDGLGGIRQRLAEGELEFDFPVLRQLRDEGATDYVAMPLWFSDGQTHALALATDAPEGFSTKMLGRIFEASAILARLYEVLTLRRETPALLDTYLGTRTGSLVRDGNTRRGDGRDIRAVILFCDLRDSTVLQERMTRARYLDLLNDFFDRAAAPVVARGGEILKFIGDAVLAIFPLDADGDDDAKRACRLARDAATEIRDLVACSTSGEDGAPLRCAIGVHLGDVMYGNVGTSTRLDFTVIGSAANIAARLSTLGKQLEQTFLLSADVARHVPDGLVALGRHRLHNVRDEVEVFGAAPVVAKPTD